MTGLVAGLNSVEAAVGASLPDSCMRGGYSIGLDDRAVPKLEWSDRCPGWADCPAGSYCADDDAVRRLCPAGRFGADTRMRTSACSGECAAGYTCNEGSTTAAGQGTCVDASTYCPSGSSSATPVTSGFYSVGVAGGIPEPGDGSLPRVGQMRCPAGMYCRGGEARLCPAGRFGSSSGLTNDECSGSCSAGFYCPSGSISAKQVSCGVDSTHQFCPAGSAKPQPTTRGHYAVRSEAVGGGASLAGRMFNRTGYDSEVACEVGHYCMGGIKYQCAAGRYGAQPEETDDSCTGECLAGYYCPMASVSKTQVVCGNSSVFCPGGSASPSIVAPGHYTYASTSARLELRHFDSVDVNGDSYITWEEFASHTSGVMVGSAIDHTAEAEVHELFTLWQTADQDTNELLDHREFGLVLDVADPYFQLHINSTHDDFEADRHPQLSVVQTRHKQAVSWHL